MPSYLLWGFSFLISVAWAFPIYQDAPIVMIKNGTLAGAYDPIRHQDAFLGVPFASSPVGQLRFAMPQPAEAWRGIKLVNSYGPWCMGNSVGLLGFSQNTTTTMSEDCLQLNVIRPSGVTKCDKLPVLAWIHGGGWNEGSANDMRYNGSFLVETSVKMGTPIIFVSFNYRLGVFGMMNGPAVDSPNVFVHDQRQALRWIQENIGHFGGDRSRVTLAGESAGATSVGQHIIAYGGRDEGLFSGAIAQSGGPLSSVPFLNTTESDGYYKTVLNATGCTNATDHLSCLRSIAAERLRTVSLLLPTAFVVDGTLFPTISSRLLQTGRFIKVPLLIGSNRNEGTSLLQLADSHPINTEDDFLAYVHGALYGRAVPAEALSGWSQLYQDEVNNPSVAGLGTVLPNPGPQLGAQFGKASLWTGDSLFIAARRYANQRWADSDTPSYSYFFDTITADVDPKILGVAHFQEIPFMFGNTNATGYDVDPFPSDPETRRKYYKLADTMSRMWISFAVTRTPNFHGLSDVNVTWPMYSRGEPTNLVFSAENGMYTQPDTWRAEALDLFARLASDMDR